MQFRKAPVEKLKAMKQLTQWRKLNGERIKIPITDEMNSVLKAELEAGYELKVCIGTDSQVKSRVTEFATVIVFIRKGRGGFMYILNDITTQKMTIKERMLTETAKSVAVGFELCNIFSRYGVSMEIHADINTNPNFKSNDAFKEAMGYITGMGFAFKAKPEAFASSSCANKMVQ